MKINRNNSAVHFLYEDLTPFHFRVCEDIEHTPVEYKRKFAFSIIREWPKVQPLFKKKVQFISDPFHKAYEKATPKLANVLDNEPINESGTFISYRQGGINTIFYHIRSEGKDKDFRLGGMVFFFGKDVDRDLPSLDIFTQRLEIGTKEYLSSACEKTGTTSFSIFADLFTLLLFIKYCELETKVIPAGRKDKHVGQKYVNETKQAIEVLDSTWFTTIVRSEGFNVGGHFRMQPWGPGMSQRRLQWIEPFEKHGYTKRAKIIAQQ